MRELVDAERIRRFMRAVGSAARHDGDCYLVGGRTAVLLGWRTTTVDVDVTFVPEQDEVLRELPRIKSELSVNVELVSPGDFVPLPDGWENRSVFVGREGRLTFRHFDPYSQALAKLERAHERDLGDVQAFVDARLVDPVRLRGLLAEIEPRLYRFPAVDARALRRRVEAVS